MKMRGGAPAAAALHAWVEPVAVFPCRAGRYSGVGGTTAVFSSIGNVFPQALRWRGQCPRWWCWSRN